MCQRTFPTETISTSHPNHPAQTVSPRRRLFFIFIRDFFGGRLQNQDSNPTKVKLIPPLTWIFRIRINYSLKYFSKTPDMRFALKTLRRFRQHGKNATPKSHTPKVGGRFHFVFSFDPSSFDV